MPGFSGDRFGSPMTGRSSSMLGNKGVIIGRGSGSLGPGKAPTVIPPMPDRGSGSSDRGTIVGRGSRPPEAPKPPSVAPPSMPNRGSGSPGDRDSVVGRGSRPPDSSRPPSIAPPQMPRRGDLPGDANWLKGRGGPSDRSDRFVPKPPTEGPDIGRGRIEPGQGLPDLGKERPSERGPIFRRPPTDTPADSGRGIPAADSAEDFVSRGTPSGRGLIDQFQSRSGQPIAVPDVNSTMRGPGHEILPPPPPPPFGGRLHDRYWDRAYDHYGRYGDRWFGGAPSWRRFMHTVAPAPWFWPHYSYVCTWPWVYGYYDPWAYVSSGWWAPYWNGRVYTPWWSWCDAPFVYYYYRYPARFSFHVTIGGGYNGYNSYYDAGYYDDYDTGYYDSGDYDTTYYDVYDGGADIVTTAVDRPLGIWVPGHWEQRYVVDTEWVWVPGYYVY